MKRKDFLLTAGMASAAAVIPFSKTLAAKPTAAAGCTIIPTETAGPYPLDLTANTTYLRQDIRESKKGVQLNVKLKIIGDGNCLPMQNLRVNIWHCDKDGLYSGYDTTNNKGQSGLTYLRGYQFTDANGEVEFITIFPGWYTGRVTHIHFQVYVSSSYAAISQLTFDVTSKNKIYTDNSSLYTNGKDPMSLSSDNIFSDGYVYQMASLTANSTTGGYDCNLEVTIKGNGTVGIGHIEKENAKQFVLGQNYPNPYVDETTIPVHLKYTSDVRLDLYDTNGKKVAEILYNGLAAGDHDIKINPSAIGIAHGNYIYQLQVENSNGIFRDCKMMTAK